MITVEGLKIYIVRTLLHGVYILAILTRRTGGLGKCLGRKTPCRNTSTAVCQLCLTLRNQARGGLKSGKPLLGCLRIYKKGWSTEHVSRRNNLETQPRLDQHNRERGKHSHQPFSGILATNMASSIHVSKSKINCQYDQ